MINNILNRLLEEEEIKLKGGLYYYTQVKFAYNSNKIEGSTLTEDETRFIYEKNLITAIEKKVIKVDDIVEVKNHFRCFDYVLKTAEKILSESIIKEYHRLLKSGTTDSEKEWFNVGGYKKLENTVANTVTTPVSKVEEEMKILIDNYTKKEKINVEDIIDFHYHLEKIHPFQDGNGRVGRLVMLKECLKNNIVPFIIHDINKDLYYQGLREYETTKKVLKDVCLYEQDKYSAVMDYFKISYNGWEKIERTNIPGDKYFIKNKMVEILHNDILKKCNELEKKDIKTNDIFLSSYYDEIKKISEYLNNIMNKGEIDKNYYEEIIELKAACKMDEKELIGKEDMLSKGKMRALLDLELGFNNMLNMPEQQENIFFTGIDL